MATILEFQRTGRKPKTDALGARTRRDCEVVLFPGVRYERWGNASAYDRGTGHGRDRLDLET